MELIDSGLEDMQVFENVIKIYCDIIDFNNLQIKLEELKIEINKSELQRIPLSTKISVAKTENI